MQTRQVVLITGASSGIGAAFARKLAAKGYDLILVARRAERLVTLAAELEQAHAVTADILVADLADSAEIKKVEQHIAKLETLTMLINNAGFATTGRFAQIDLSRQIDMIHVHLIASVRFSRAALPAMITRGQGVIINVSSMAGFFPMPGNVIYCATKAYLNSFSLALQSELAGTGVQVQALCPGFTYTEFHDTPEYQDFDRARIPKMMWMPAEEVVEGSLKALAHGKVIVVPGVKNRLLTALIHLVPSSLPQWIYRQQFSFIKRRMP